MGAIRPIRILRKPPGHLEQKNMKIIGSHFFWCPTLYVFGSQGKNTVRKCNKNAIYRYRLIFGSENS
jgi:hypothetical protein